MKILICIFLLCFSPFRDSSNKSKEIDLFDQYSFLLRRSFQFCSNDNNRYFLDSLKNYCSGCATFSSHERLEPVICLPVLLNSTENKAIILVLKRGKGYETGEPQELVRIISAKFENAKWQYLLNPTVQYSYSYHNNKSPILSDQEITLRTLRKLIDLGYMKVNSLEIQDDFFKSPIFGW